MTIRQLFQNVDRSNIETWCRARTQQAFLGDHQALARVLGQFLMYVDTRDLSLTPHLLMNGYWEMWVTQAVVSYVKPGMHCIDVGANVGYYTLLLSELAGEAGLVVAYEPFLPLVKILKRSLLVNGSSAQVLPRAASDRRGHSDFFGVEGFEGSGSLAMFPCAQKVETGLPFGQVSVSTIDEDTGSRLPRIDFVKIDAQGHELNVLRGMEQTIELNPQIAIAMEFTPGEHQDPAAAMTEILSYGLKLQAIGTDGIVRPITPEEAIKPDTGDHRMLWLGRS